MMNLISDFMLAQFGGDWVSTIVWIILIIVSIFFGPRLMTTQTILKLEKEATDLEQMAEKSKGYILKSISKKSKKDFKKQITNFMEFFAVTPIETDPYGIMKKLDHIIKNYDSRFKYFVDQINPNASENEKKNIKNALSGAITTHQIAKIVRHYVELIKKYKMFQYAMVIQMQIPLITSIAKASMKATYAFVNGIPIGDGTGPLISASLIKEKPKKFKDEEFVIVKTKINGRDVWISKADGPGATTGYPGKFLTKLLKKQKISKIITIDAGLKLEGEKTGTVAEGVGIAMGGIGVERYEIEQVAVKKKIPLDAVVIKVSNEEALMPMKKEVFDSIPIAVDAVKASINRSNKKDKILIIGVGNTCGVGNDSKTLGDVEKKVKKHGAKKKEKKKIFKF
jgi:hypothetical protein